LHKNKSLSRTLTLSKQTKTYQKYNVQLKFTLRKNQLLFHVYIFNLPKLNNFGVNTTLYDAEDNLQVKKLTFEHITPNQDFRLD